MSKISSLSTETECINFLINKNKYFERIYFQNKCQKIEEKKKRNDLKMFNKPWVEKMYSLEISIKHFNIWTPNFFMDESPFRLILKSTTVMLKSTSTQTGKIISVYVTRNMLQFH